MRYLILVCLITIPLITLAQKNKKANVLSYYAVTNSIDGQPLIKERNLLRFYPVFALRDSINTVKITIYYGTEVFIDFATKFNEGLYWEVKLPEFDFGDAIQRYEVETTIKYNINIERQLLAYKDEINKNNKALTDKIQNTLTNFDLSYRNFIEAFDRSTELIGVANKRSDSIMNKLNQMNALLNGLKMDSIQKNLIQENNALRIKINALAEKAKEEKILEDNLNINENYSNIGQQLKNDILLKVSIGFAPIAFVSKEQESIAKYITSQEYLIDSLKGNLLNKLTDKDFSGTGIQKSDILFSRDYKSAKILYRNYRIENRVLVALDPAEKLSIFRVRYIPFPVIGKNLEGPSREGIPIVFEAGVTFGNQVITSNEFFKPELSIRRMGVAVAFTPQLFSNEAKILALLFTYDFNAYASIGVGANFGTLSPDAPDPYFSFGINQKAFQRLLFGLTNLFKK